MPIKVTLLGIVIEVSPVHPLNSPSPIDVKVSGKVILDMVVLPLNGLPDSHCVTPFGITIDVLVAPSSVNAVILLLTIISVP